MAVQLLLEDLILHRQRVPLRGCSHLFARDIDDDAAFGPVDVNNRIGREQHLLARQPVARRDDQIADVPIFVVGQQILDMPDVAVGRVDAIADDVGDAAEMRIAGWRRLRLPRCNLGGNREFGRMGDNRVRAEIR